jgi:hypothetical protein
MEAVKTQLVKREETFDLVSFSDAEARAERLAKSSLLPPDLRGKPADVLVVMVTGHELGLQPMQALRGIHVIKGRPVLSADLMVALCKRSQACQFFRLVSSSGKEATYETQRQGDPQPTKMTWTIEQAQTAGLMGNDNWKRHPDAMLRARCSSALARAVYPDLVGGMYEEDEGREIQEPRRVAAVTHYQAPAAEMTEAEVVDPTTGEVMAPEAPQTEPSFEETVAGWKGLIDGADTIEALEGIGKELGRQYAKGHAVRQAVNETYSRRQAELRRA